jgi:hypothetical protein
MATEALTRAARALYTDAIPHANNLAYTVPGGKAASVYGLVCNVHSTNSGMVDVVVDAAGFYRFIVKNLVVPQGATIVLPTFTMLAGDNLRVRASANSTLEFYGSLIEVS